MKRGVLIKEVATTGRVAGSRAILLLAVTMISLQNSARLNIPLALSEMHTVDIQRQWTVDHRTSCQSH
jgi:hypothetical protein